MHGPSTDVRIGMALGSRAAGADWRAGSMRRCLGGSAENRCRTPHWSIGTFCHAGNSGQGATASLASTARAVFLESATYRI